MDMGARSRLCAPTFCASKRPNLLVSNFYLAPLTVYLCPHTQAAYNEWDASPFMCSNVSCVQNTISLIQTGQLDRAFLRARVCYIIYVYVSIYVSISMSIYLYIYVSI